MAAWGGKKRLPATASFIVSAFDAVCAKAFGPFVDKPAPDIDRTGNMGNRGAIDHQEDDAAAFGQSRSDGGRPLPSGEDVPLCGDEVNNHTGFSSSCHRRNLRERDE
jgi:hypothetical protein